MFRNLDAGKITQTVAHLRDRINERFPNSSLGRVAAELGDVARESQERSAWVGRPIIWLRVLVWTLVALMLATLLGGLYHFQLPARFQDWGDFIQTLESGINDIVLIGAGVYFLLTIEGRIKRKAVLRAVHELRSLAHVVDMHQLTKDPEQTLASGHETTSSPRRTMTGFELARYLTYCTELLSHIGKVAALHVQSFDDPVTLEAVDDIEDLTTGLSRKIWQKIALLGQQPMA